MDFFQNLSTPAMWVLFTFVIGYTFIIFEHVFNINKTTSAIITAVIAWAIIFMSDSGIHTQKVHFLEDLLAEITQIFLFLTGALIIVETINAHKGFNFITASLHFKKKQAILWVIGIVTFFLSAILDNLTTTIVMVTLLQKLVPDQKDRWILGSAVVIAANAGGAWTPIGDVTTTMLWIGGQLTTLNIIKALFIPSVVCLLLSFVFLHPKLKGEVKTGNLEVFSKVAPHGRAVLFIGLGLLIFIPIFKLITGLPPFMGMLFAVSILWLYTDLAHYKYSDRSSLKMMNIIRKIDLPSVLFFVGILLAVGALEEIGILTDFASVLDENIKHPVLIATLIGFLSAIVDNVPLVAASMGMYKLTFYPTDSNFWEAVAYAAGTGGSMLIIGSAAGVVFMGIEDVDFFWYLKNITLAALIGFLGGIVAYVFIHMSFLELLAG
jgi:Na+/H+ antiporter NhaD/arsenite permease-like protein